MTDYAKSLAGLIVILLSAKIVAIMSLYVLIPYAVDYIDRNPEFLDKFGNRYSRTGYEDNLPLSALCCHWDSEHYLRISERGYDSEMLYAFSPGYPMLIRIVSFLVSDRLLAAVLISNFFSIASVMAFYFTARLYLTERESVYASFFFMLFPTVFVYGTVAYTEPMFLTFTILGWYFFERKKYLNAGSLLAAASLTRYSGLVLYPILSFLLVRERGLDFKGLIRLNAPAVAVIVFFLALQSTTQSSYSAIQKTYWDTQLEYPLAFLGYVKLTAGSVLKDPTFYFILFMVLGIMCYRIRPRLALYALTLTLFYSSFVGVAAASIPRFLATAWPAFLPLGRYLKNTLVVVTVLAYFWIFSVLVLIVHTLWIFYA
ncbi:MAG: mannosyltransferase family protein [Candidatus Altiarchaeota archaeon]